jgi:PTS system nitrogen regulatory IIA component
MLLTVQDVARLLRTTDRQVYRWVDEEEIPYQRIRDQIRFNRTELLEWATSRRLPISLETFDEDDQEAEEPTPTLAAALQLGGVHQDAGGSDSSSVLRGVIDRTPLPASADRELVTEVLIAREAASSTAIGDGIAVPHVRHPIVAPGAPPSVGVHYLQTPIPFGAPDGKPVRTVFMIVSPTVRAHLRIFARLAHALQDPGFAQAIERRAPVAELVAEAARLEARLAGADGGAERRE